MKVNLLQGTCTPTLTPMPGVHRVRAVIADRPPHTTEHAGPHSAVQAGWEVSRCSLKAGSMTLRRRAAARTGLAQSRRSPLRLVLPGRSFTRPLGTELL